MTEGSIAAWRVKEGDRFAAGDVLLEIETDKATMDVEAQEDGVVFKIVQPDGSKGVPVGTRIAVLAEADDDVASLEMPPDEAPPAKEAAAGAPAPVAAAAPTPVAAAPAAPAPAPSGAKQAARWPLYPSVAHLIKESGLDPAAVVGDMTPTGPGNRLLKGDVLAFLGKVAPGVPAALEARFDKLAHLDLSNIKIKETPKKEAAAEAPAAAAAKKALAAAPKETTTSISLPVSLAAVLDAQDKMQASLGVFMPLSTFVARATDVANDALPRAGPPPPPSAAALFDAIVAPAGQRVSSAAAAAAASRVSRGSYRPQISALSQTGGPAKKAKADVIDILTGKAKATTPARTLPRVAGAAPAVSTGINFFTVSVPKSEEKRAKVFLERLKLVLENEPGRLVL